VRVPEPTPEPVAEKHSATSTSTSSSSTSEDHHVPEPVHVPAPAPVQEVRAPAPVHTQAPSKKSSSSSSSSNDEDDLPKASSSFQSLRNKFSAEGAGKSDQPGTDKEKAQAVRDRLAAMVRKVWSPTMFPLFFPFTSFLNIHQK
jgi:hypothetical protein